MLCHVTWGDCDAEAWRSVHGDEALGKMGVAEKIKEVEDEMARTQKNKATE